MDDYLYMVIGYRFLWMKYICHLYTNVVYNIYIYIHDKQTKKCFNRKSNRKVFFFIDKIVFLYIRKLES